MEGEVDGAGVTACAMPAAAKALRIVSDTLIAVGDVFSPAAANAWSMVDEMELMFIGRENAAVHHIAPNATCCLHKRPRILVGNHLRPTAPRCCVRCRTDADGS